MFDAHHSCGLTGYSATVFLGNLFTLPTKLSAFLNLPREVYDNIDEIITADWRVD